MSKYHVILADPPWNHYNALNYRHAGDPRPPAPKRQHYATLTVPQICRLPIGDMAACDAALLLWACTPLLPDALQVMQAWGFRYVTTAFAWVKRNRDGSPVLGLGQYTRQNTELCLLGRRGHIRSHARNVSQIILAPRRQHSRKPDEQYDRIMRLFDGPYLELFARQQWPGWDVWGNQTGLFPAQPFLMREFAS